MAQNHDSHPFFFSFFVTSKKKEGKKHKRSRERKKKLGETRYNQSMTSVTGSVATGSYFIVFFAYTKWLWVLDDSHAPVRRIVGPTDVTIPSGLPGPGLYGSTLATASRPSTPWTLTSNQALQVTWRNKTWVIAYPAHFDNPTSIFFYAATICLARTVDGGRLMPLPRTRVAADLKFRPGPYPSFQFVEKPAGIGLLCGAGHGQQTVPQCQCRELSRRGQCHLGPSWDRTIGIHSTCQGLRPSEYIRLVRLSVLP